MSLGRRPVDGATVEPVPYAADCATAKWIWGWSLNVLTSPGSIDDSDYPQIEWTAVSGTVNDLGSGSVGSSIFDGQCSGKATRIVGFRLHVEFEKSEVVKRTMLAVLSAT